ncbi:MAG: CvpA family protein [Acidobacteriaceae bacterium]
MNPLDWILALLLAYSVIRGLIRGFFQEAFALGGVVAGFLLACWFYLPLAAKIKGLLPSPVASELAAFLLILAGSMIVATLIGKLLRHTASAIGLGLVDRLLGGVFGLIRGSLLVVTILLALTAFLPNSAWLKNSHLAPYFLQAAHAVSFLMPSYLRLRLLEGLKTLKHTTPDWIKQGL